MYNLLKGKKGIIFGALDENSIAWKTAERVHEEGGQFVLTNAPVAMRMGKINDLAEKTGAQIIPADATNMEDLQNLVVKAMEILGGKLDFVLHSIAMYPLLFLPAAKKQSLFSAHRFYLYHSEFQ